jgi:MFS family permease
VIASGSATTDRRGPLRALWLATGISLVGNQLTGLALPWLVLTSLGRPFDAGIVGAAIVLPAVFGALAGGVVIDRFGPRRTSVVADILSGAAVAAVPVAAWTVGLGLPLVVALAFLGALLDAPGATARQVILPELAVAGGMRLERANAIFQAIENGSLLIGPAIAGVIVLVLGPLGALWLDAGSFVVSAVLIRLLVPDIRPGDGTDEPVSLAAGLRALGRDPVLRLLTLVAAIANLVGTPLFIVILPALATTGGQSAAAAGAMLAALGGGMVVGALAIGAVAGRVGRRVSLIAGFTGTGFGLVAAAAVEPLPILLAVLFAAGIATGLINPIAFTIMQERVPPAARGRVFGAILGGVLVAAPIGMIALGSLADVQGPRAALLVSGVTFVAIGGLVAIRRESRELEAPLFEATQGT